MFLQRVLTYTAFGLLIASAAHAKLFANSYISFELPPNWDCKLDGTEYVCVSLHAKQAKEAIIILAAKEAGPTDSLPAYTTHLKTPRKLTDKTGKEVSSKVISVQERRINNHAWIDGWHEGSEIVSYYTRYLATVKDRLAILVTFSAHREHYTKYSQDFMNAINSLRVIAGPDVFKPAPGTMRNTGPIGPAPVDPVYTEYQPPPPQEPTGGGMFEKVMALVLLLGAIGFYLWRKKK